MFAIKQLVRMALITLTSDWQNDDFYIGAMKGLLYSEIPQVQVVDISHKIDSFKYTQAAFVVRNSFLHFPKGTIHIVAINSEIQPGTPAVCIQVKGHYFIGAASGIFSLIFSENPEKVVEIQSGNRWQTSSFNELSLFAKAAAFIANGGNMDELGPEIPDKVGYVKMMPVYDEFEIAGSVLYIDSYNNVFTNITRSMFDQVIGDKKFSITLKSDSNKVTRLSQNYSEVDVAEMLALFNSLDLLEIALRNAPLAKLLDVKINDHVIVKRLPKN